MRPPTFDERDEAILCERTEALNKRDGPRIGDFVIFADGIERRISYIWGFENQDGFWSARPDSVQTSDGGSYYLGEGYVSMSGSLYTSVPIGTLADTGERKAGQVWFF